MQELLTGLILLVINALHDPSKTDSVQLEFTVPLSLCQNDAEIDLDHLAEQEQVVHERQQCMLPGSHKRSRVIMPLT